MSKNIIISQLTSSGYQELYPKTIASQVEGGSANKVFTGTITTNWTEDSTTGVKTQTVSISGIKATNTAIVDHAGMDSASTDYNSFVQAENQYLTCITNGYAETVANGIKFYIFGDANTVAIPIIVEAV